jgi:hypothetical protein
MMSGPIKANSLMVQPQSAINVISPASSPAYSGLIGDSSVTTPSWNLAQWNTPTPISGAVMFAPNTNWTVNSSATPATNPLTVKFGTKTGAYTLYQNMQTQVPGAPNYRACTAGETDLYLAPNGAYTMYQSKNPAAHVDSYSLPVGALSTLTLQLSLGIGLAALLPTEYVTTAHCRGSYVAYLFALTANNTKTGQAMFYQVFLRDSRGLVGTVPTSCVGYPVGGVFCFSTNLLYLLRGTVQGSAMQAVGSNVNYTVNLLPGLLALIRSGARGLDPNPNDWVVDGGFVGQAGDGDFRAQSTWASMALTAY